MGKEDEDEDGDEDEDLVVLRGRLAVKRTHGGQKTADRSFTGPACVRFTGPPCVRFTASLPLNIIDIQSGSYPNLTHLISE